MEPEEHDDDLGAFGIPNNVPATDDNGRSQRLGQQRMDFNISPPTIPRSHTANIFTGGAFSSTSGQFQQFTPNSLQQQQPLPQFVQGQIPSYNQGGSQSSQHFIPPSNVNWESRIVPQAQYAGTGQNYFTPLHSTSSNEESKVPALINPASPVGVTSPGLVNFTSPLYQRSTNTNTVPAAAVTAALSPASPTESVRRPPSASTIGTANSSESIDSVTRSNRKRNRKNLGQRKVRASQEATISEENNPNSKSPPPQNLRGDPFRSAKVKTELCRHYNTPKGCPFGDKCNYAHGEHELKYTKLMDLERAGLVDIEIFRTHPCPTWVATGACPFDQRCIGLHDPRVGGSQQNSAWLPHAETMINKIGSGHNVDKFYHERMSSIYNSCPIYGYVPKQDRGSATDGDESTWTHFYDFICNTKNNSLDVPFNTNKHTLQELSEEHKLEIVLKMRQLRTGQEYAYIPTHLFCGDLCMILQEKKFQLLSIIESNDKGFSTVLEETTGECCVPVGSLEFKVHEIAFGPVGDPTVRPPSIWFDIPKDDLTPCTPQQAKHHKRSRHRIKKTPNKISPHQADSQAAEKFKSIRITPFYHYQPHDHVTFDLITSILVHRLKMVKFLSGKFDDTLHEIGPLLDTERSDLKRKFLNLLQFWVLCSWPEELLREPIHDDTDVPPVNGKYTCSVGSARFSRGTECYGLGMRRYLFDLPLKGQMFPAILWKSFTTNMLISSRHDVDYIRRETQTQYDGYFNSLCRLPILRHLSMGGMMSKNRYLPHFRSSRGVGPSSLSQCIEDLLGDWESLRAHYDEDGTTSTPLRRTNSNIDVVETSPAVDNPSDDSLGRHLKSSAKMFSRMSF